MFGTIKHHFKNFGDLWGLLVFTAFMGLALIFSFPHSVSVFLSVLFIFFCPGYALSTAIYSEKNSISNIQLVLASIGSSIIVTSLLLLPVSYKFGLTQKTGYITISSFILLMVLTAYIRRLKTPPEKTYKPFEFFNTQILPFWTQKEQEKRHNTLIIVFTICLIFFAAGHLLWSTRGVTPQYTELYLLGQQGMAANYPEHAQPDGTIDITVGVVHHGKQAKQYLLVYQIDEDTANTTTIRKLTLNPGEKKETITTIKLKDTAAIQKISFLLYELPEHKLQRKLHLWVDTQPVN